jgi:hypothetical protein
MGDGVPFIRQDHETVIVGVQMVGGHACHAANEIGKEELVLEEFSNWLWIDEATELPLKISKIIARDDRILAVQKHPIGSKTVPSPEENISQRVSADAFPDFFAVRADDDEKANQPLQRSAGQIGQFRKYDKAFSLPTEPLQGRRHGKAGYHQSDLIAPVSKSKTQLHMRFMNFSL